MEKWNSKAIPRVVRLPWDIFEEDVKHTVTEAYFAGRSEPEKEGQEPSSGSSEEAHFAYFQRFKTEVFPTHITGAEKGHRREPPPRAQRPVLDVDIEEKQSFVDAADAALDAEEDPDAAPAEEAPHEAPPQAAGPSEAERAAAVTLTRILSDAAHPRSFVECEDHPRQPESEASQAEDVGSDQESPEVSSEKGPDTTLEDGNEVQAAAVSEKSQLRRSRFPLRPGDRCWAPRWRRDALGRLRAIRWPAVLQRIDIGQMKANAADCHLLFLGDDQEEIWCASTTVLQWHEHHGHASNPALATAVRQAKELENLRSCDRGLPHVGCKSAGMLHLSSRGLFEPGLPPGRGGFESRTFSFDQVYDSGATDDQVFAGLEEELRAALDGEAVCILAYGATGSGKTHTVSNLAERVALTLSCEAEILEKDGVQLEVLVQVVEIYNEHFRESARDDLLTAEVSPETPRLKMSSPSSSATLQGATQRRITREKDMLKSAWTLLEITPGDDDVLLHLR
eukprot:g24255.t1